MDYSSEELQRTLKDQSMNGEAGRRNSNRKISMYFKDYKRTIAAVAIASSIAITSVIGGGQAVVNNTRESIAVGSLISNFKKDCVNKETHRTDNLQYYYYDYDNIARYIEQMDDYELGVYLCCRSIGVEQTRQVMQFTNYRSFENFLESHNYEDLEDFEKKMRDRAVLVAQISQKEEELAQMRAEHEISLPDVTMEDQAGGQK